MLRFRRYRVFLVLAMFAVLALYHFTSVRDWESATAASVKGLQNLGHKTEQEQQQAQSLVLPEKPFEEVPVHKNPQIIKENDAPAQPLTPIAETVSPAAPVIEAEKTPTPAAKEAISPLSATTSAATSTTSTNPVLKIPAPPQQAIASPAPFPKIPPSIVDSEVVQPQDGHGSYEPPPLISDKPIIHWTSLPEHFPLPTESIIPIPTGSPITIPKIQHDFSDESSAAKTDRETKRAAIKKEFENAWGGYKKQAWLQDELSPVSGKSRNPFCGWAATLVDTLDTLWIMGMEEDFQEASLAVGEIDFTTSFRSDIPLFETTIRYLGGLVAAYDLSDGKYRVLLDKAVQLADVLMGAFDTPNRMPITYYQWKPTFASNAHRASTRAVLAELGSLSMEFTRLAQITKEARYYDAIARITNEFEIWQNKTQIPGMWPHTVDASGCRKPENKPSSQIAHSLSNAPDPKKQLPNPATAKSDKTSAGTRSEEALQDTSQDTTTVAGISADGEVDQLGRQMKSTIANWGGPVDIDEAGKVPTKHLVTSDLPKSSEVKKMSKRQLTNEHLVVDSITGNSSVKKAASEPARTLPTLSQRIAAEGGKKHSNLEIVPHDMESECEPQGLATPPYSMSQKFTFGGQADSIFEYLPKQHLLLGGLVPQYQRMYEAAVDAATKYLLYRPMIPESTRKTLVLGKVTTTTEADETVKYAYDYEQEHLLCFSGGMYAIGAKMFNRKKDLEIAAQLTDGCVWAYEATTSGIMAEAFTTVPCDDQNSCPWNQTLWHERLDPHRVSREQNQQMQKEQAVLREEQERAASSGPVETGAPLEEDYDPVLAASKADVREKVPLVDPKKTAAEEVEAEVVPALKRRQLGDVENDTPIAETLHQTQSGTVVSEQAAIGAEIAATMSAAQKGNPEAPVAIYNPYPTHEEYVQQRIKMERLPKGVLSIESRSYILRPEAIESVFIMYRITGDEIWREKGWKMFTAIQNYTHTEYGNSAITDVTADEPLYKDEMESFWLAETLKYFYLLFSEPSLVSLDDYVLNTEAHPFRRPK
ncbi:hypothetical protein MMC25_001427 [Agyrium rufum]|nr:hypothetical protein [Agyrium rufum]